MVRFQVTSFAVTSSVPYDLVDVWRERGSTPWIRVYGRTADGASVVMYAGGFAPYLWVETAGSPTAQKAAFVQWIASQIKSPVRKVELHDDKCSLVCNEPVRVARIELEQPGKVPKVRDLFHEGRNPTPEHPMGRRAFEADVPYHMRFAIDLGATPFCWVEVDDTKTRVSAQVPVDRCALTLSAHIDDIRFDCDDTSNAPMPVVGIDGEMIVTGEDDHFPDARAGDEIIQMGCVVYKAATADATDDNLVQRVIFTRGGEVAPFADDQRIVVRRCTDESDLLLQFRAWLNWVQPDFITGYNLDKFDWPFVLARADELGIDEEFRDIGKVPGELMESKQSNFQSGARGHEDDENVTIPGVTNVDMLRIIRNSEKLRSYRLDAVVKEAFGEQEGKVDVGHKEIPILYRGSAEDRRKLCEYCIWDAELAARLLFKKKVIVNHIEMARVTGVDIHALITGGQQIKVYNQILRECRKENLIVPTNPRERENTAGALDDDDLSAPLPGAKKKEGAATLADYLGKNKRKKEARKAAAKRKPEYEGATVIEPHKGFYDVPITTLDFSSLYPSIMRQHNLCYRSLVATGTKCAHGHDACTSNEVTTCCVTLTPHGSRFWRPHVVQGILPRILTNLLDARKRAKGEMAREADPFKKAVLDGRQLALKVSANSVYGFTGATVGKLPCIAISASVTGFGREMIHYIQGLVERKYRGAGLVNQEVSAIDLDTQVVYGDSVVGDTPILVLSPREEMLWVPAERLHAVMSCQYSDRVDGKSTFVPEGWRVWSSSGWTAVRHVIRHQATGKQLIRVCTQSGDVTVTADHSLLLADGTEVKPTDVAVGDVLMHRDLPPLPGNRWANDGHWGYVRAHAPEDAEASLNLILTDTSKDGYASVAAELPACKDGTPLYRAVREHVRAAAGCASTGDRVISVERVRLVGADEWVYDLETESHHFAAGPGRLVVHNTDSIMVNFGVQRVADAMEIGKDAAELINAAFRLKTLFPEQRDAFLAQHAPDHTDPEAALLADTARLVPIINAAYPSSIGIVFEKVLFPYLLISKKRYVGGFFTQNPEKPDKVHQSGIESVRRDNAMFTARSMGEVVERLMRTKDTYKALALARWFVRSLCTGRTQLDDLVISKGFSKPESAYVNPAGLPHMRVNKLREAREPGSGYRLGDRIPYVVVCGEEKNGKVKRLVDNVEDPDYVREKGVPISINYYLNNQVRKPLTRIFDTIWGEGASDALVFTPEMTAQRVGVPGRLFGVKQAAVDLKPLDEEDPEKMRMLVQRWHNRPKQASLFDMIRKPVAE